MSNEKRPNTLLSYNFSSKKSGFDVYLIKRISFHFFVFLLRYQYFVGPKKFWPININLANFAHRFFSIQEKFAHWSKNPGYATDWRGYSPCDSLNFRVFSSFRNNLFSSYVGILLSFLITFFSFSYKLNTAFHYRHCMSLKHQ